MARRLFIGNLAWRVTEGDLRKCVEDRGHAPASVTVLVERDTGRSRGFGFVEMGTDEEAEALRVDLDGHELEGRPIKVDFATERPRSGGGGGGGGGGRRDRDDGGGRRGRRGDDSRDW